LGNHDDPRNSYIHPGPHRLGFDGFWAAYNFHHHYVNAYYHTNSPEKTILPGYEPDAQTDLAIEQLRHAAHAGRPLALFLSYGTPHDPWIPENAPEHYLELLNEASFALPRNYCEQDDPYADAWATLRPHERDQLSQWMHIYYAMTANLDWNVGRLLCAIDNLGLRDDTIIVFTSDHGELFGAHGRRAKNIFYDEAVRVPLLMRWPKHIPAGRQSDICLNTPDIMPTLLGLLDLPVPGEVEGMDLSHRVLGHEGPEPDAAFLQCTGATAAWQDGYEWRALRDKRFTYAVYRLDQQELLFDNHQDPYQMTNLVTDPAYKSTATRFRELLRTRMIALDDTFETCTWYRDHWTEDRIIHSAARGSFGRNSD
jgi:arylsulfatase A-like enzyme